MTTYEDIVFTEADLRPRRRPLPVTFGPWEPILGPERTRLVATDVRGAFVSWVAEYTQVTDRPLLGYRRRRMERWYDDDGRMMGRWEWQYASTAFEVVP